MGVLSEIRTAAQRPFRSLWLLCEPHRSSVAVDLGIVDKAIICILHSSAFAPHCPVPVNVPRAHHVSPTNAGKF